MPGPWEKYRGQQPQMVAPNPMFPGQMQGQQLNNAGQGLTNQEKAATLPYAAPKAAADASNAQIQANVNAATAPAEIAQKNANARQTAAQAATAEANLETTGGANEGQAKSASFYTRAARANQMFESTGIKDNPQGREIAKTLLPDSLVNRYTSPERQKAEAAQRDFIAATLRYESGANIPQNEFDLQKSIYFPAPGDAPETLKAKAELRRNALDGLRVASGPAAPLLEQPQQGLAQTSVTDIAKPVIRNEYDPQTSAAMDQLIRMGRPPREVAAFAASKGYDVTPDTLATIAEAQLYLKQHPNYKGSFAEANKSVPMSMRQKVAGSPIGAFGASAGNAATLGLSDEIAGGINAIGGGSYTQGRDAFNANKQLLSDAHPIADLLGTAAGSAPLMAIGGGLAGNSRVASALQPAARYGQSAADVAGIGARRAGTLADVAYGAGFGAGENNDNRVMGGLTGAGAAYGGNLAGRAAATGLASLVSPTGGKLAPLYEMGVRPSIGQRFGGVVNNIEEKLKSFPVLGDMIEGTRDRARDQFQVGLFNDSLGEIGEKLPKGMGAGHDPHKYAQEAFRKAYDTAERGMSAVADNQLGQDLGALQQAVSTLRPDSKNVFNKIWTDSVARRFAGGHLSGDAYKDAMSEMSKKVAAIRKNPTGDHELADALEQAMGAVRGSAVRNSPPEAVAALDAVDRGYAKLVRVEDASQRAGGDAATFTPKQYEAAVKKTSGGIRSRGYLAGDALNSDIAEAGLGLADRVSNSGTVDRLIPATMLGGIGALSPKAGAVMSLYSLINAPGVRNLTTELLAPRGGKARTIADLIRKQSGSAGTIGSAYGLGLLPPQ